jgi:hypothetical protein
MPQDSSDLVDVFFYTLGAVMCGFAIAGAAHAWRSWSHYRRIEKHLRRG